MFFKAAVICSIICLATASACTKLLGELANSQTHLLYCITTSSVPVTMCINCYQKYQEVLKSYDVLALNCASEYFDKDRINLVASMESLLTGLWSKAYCDDCFNNNNSLIFNDKYSHLDGCFITAKNESCDKCKNQYLDLNNFYINLDQHNNGEVCFDLQDSMNRTRNKWSKELKCCRREQNMTLFAIALSITFVLPLLFYCTTYLITKHREGNHGVLNDEDPLHNSSLPSTSGRSNLNNINNPVQSLIDNRPTSSNVASPSVTISSKPVQHKNGFNILNEDLESSDDDIHVNAVIDSKEKIK